MIDNTVFTNNSLSDPWYGGEAVRLSMNPYTLVVYDTHTKQNIQIKFRGAIFKNHILYESLYPSVPLSVLGIESYANVTFTNCTFMDNKATAIRAFQTNVIFEGKNTTLVVLVQDCMALFMNSYMYLKPHTNLLFANNHALSVGGAIYTDLTLEFPQLTLPCFFQVLTEGQEEPLSTISVEFINNTARVAAWKFFVWRLY